MADKMIRFKPMTVGRKTYYMQDPDGPIEVSAERIAFSGQFWEDHWSENKVKTPLFFIRDTK